MPLDDRLAEGKSESQPGIFLRGVQTAEHDEDPFVLLGIDSDTVVTDGEQPFAFAFFRADFDLRCPVFPPEYHGIVDQMCEDFFELVGIRGHDRQRPAANTRPTSLDDRCQVLFGGIEHGVAVDRRARLATRRYARKPQESFEEYLGFDTRFYNTVRKSKRFRAPPFLAAVLEDLRERTGVSDGPLQIVRNGVQKAVQFSTQTLVFRQGGSESRLHLLFPDRLLHPHTVSVSVNPHRVRRTNSPLTFHVPASNPETTCARQKNPKRHVCAGSEMPQ